MVKGIIFLFVSVALVFSVMFFVDGDPPYPKKWPDPLTDPIEILVCRGDEENLENRLRSGTDPNTIVEQTKESLLDVAMSISCIPKHNTLNVVKLLVKYGGNINLRNSYGGTPLMSAVQGGEIEVAKYYLDRGANPNLLNTIGESALTKVKSSGGGQYLELAELLITHGADPMIKADNGISALQWAISNGHDDLARLYRVAGK